MSRIGKIPVPVPDGVKVQITGRKVDVSGPLGQLSWDLPEGIRASTDGDANTVVVEREGETKERKALHGLTRSLILNMVLGVKEGYQKRLLVFGTGYGCQVQGRTLHLNVGFMGRGGKNKPQFEIPIPDGVEVVIETPAARGDVDPAKFVVKGCDKQAVGQFAAEVRKIRPPEPYKGKGIRYDDEHVQRKQGKAFAGGG